jgi:hypothetical protein
MNYIKTSLAKKFEAGGYEVHFPFEPYEIQKKFIES